MKEITSTSLFGVMISIMAFEVGVVINRKTKKSFLNPLLIGIIIVIFIINFFKISIEDYNKGAQILYFFLTPATVSLAVPLYKNLALLKKHKISILIGIFIGCVTSVTSIILLSKAFKLKLVLGLSLVPKSVTTPIGIEISKQIGGIPEITVAAIVITGITGAILAPTILKVFRIKDPVAAGIAIGTSSHVLGTSKAIEIGEVEGAMSGLAIGISGLITVLIAPVIIKILQYF